MLKSRISVIKVVFFNTLRDAFIVRATLCKITLWRLLNISLNRVIFFAQQYHCTKKLFPLLPLGKKIKNSGRFLLAGV